jgi:hypothetical protein
MDRIRFQEKIVALDQTLLISLFRECQPRILVVTDTLSYNSAGGFGLTQFVNTLRTSTIHGMTPVVTTASRTADATADLPSYDFNHATNGLLISRYDVVFLFGVRSEGNLDLPQAQVDTIAKFMEAGGGVFATGDHETLGASLCGNIPRVRNMRRWKNAQTPPNVSSVKRHSTNLSGPNESEEFSDQSNTEPQRLYLNFRSKAGGVGNPHPLVQLKAPRRALEVYPDHPHEGECLVPASLAGTFSLAGTAVPEWPNDLTGAALSPEVVAMSVSHGDGFDAKEALEPRLFAAIVAYDGHRANKGRVSTDSTWHHFININLDGTGAPGLTGLQTPAGVDTEALTRIREHFVNLATWLMPKRVRQCRRFPLVLEELARFPLFEELELPPLKEITVTELTHIGGALLQSLSRRVAPWELRALVSDTLADGIGEAEALKLLDDANTASALRNNDIAQAVVGGLLVGVASRLAELPSVKEIVPHQTFEPAALEATRLATKLALARRRDQLKNMDELISRAQNAGNLR